MFYKVSTSTKENCQEKVQINKLTSTYNPQANGSGVLLNQNMRFAKAMLLTVKGTFEAYPGESHRMLLLGKRTRVCRRAYTL